MGETECVRREKTCEKRGWNRNVKQVQEEETENRMMTVELGWATEITEDVNPECSIMWLN